MILNYNMSAYKIDVWEDNTEGVTWLDLKFQPVTLCNGRRKRSWNKARGMGKKLKWWERQRGMWVWTLVSPDTPANMTLFPSDSSNFFSPHCSQDHFNPFYNFFLILIGRWHVYSSILIGNVIFATCTQV